MGDSQFEATTDDRDKKKKNETERSREALHKNHAAQTVAEEDASISDAGTETKPWCDVCTHIHAIGEASCTDDLVRLEPRLNLGVMCVHIFTPLGKYLVQMVYRIHSLDLQV